MLQQILQDMWVDPQILAELDDDQKQTLFCRMREEQVRRWQLWDQQQLAPRATATKHSTTGGKRVGFLLGKDGEPWVWVMGEHPDDKSIEDILEEEARHEARRLAQLEAQQMRVSMETELSELLDLNARQIKAMEDEGHGKQGGEEEDEAANIYCSVDELMKKADQPVLPYLDTEKRQHIMAFDKQPSSEVTRSVTLWERKVMEERTSEIFKNLQQKKAQVEREAQEAQSKQECMWQEQERRAKEAETQIREIARRAREQHRRTSVLLDSAPQSPTSPVVSSDSRRLLHAENALPTPLDRDAVVQWYRCSEVPRGAGVCLSTHSVQPWFHGLISRQEAECLLRAQPIGTFLVRVSEKIWGYAISYRDADRCKHYLVDASNGHYQFLGSNHVVHDSLADMVEYHASNIITVACNELLKYPCPRVGTPAILQGVWS